MNKLLLALGAKDYILKAEHRLEDIIGTIRDMLEKQSNQSQNPVGNSNNT